jgi:hypothetical protein
VCQGKGVGEGPPRGSESGSGKIREKINILKEKMGVCAQKMLKLLI